MSTARASGVLELDRLTRATFFVTFSLNPVILSLVDRENLLPIDDEVLVPLLRPALLLPRPLPTLLPPLQRAPLGSTAEYRRKVTGRRGSRNRCVGREAASVYSSSCISLAQGSVNCAGRERCVVPLDDCDGCGRERSSETSAAVSSRDRRL